MVSSAEAKARLSALVDRMVAGKAAVVTRRGRAVARHSAMPGPKRPIDLETLRAVTAAMPLQPEGAATFVRAMRDDERY
ncbi:type II toxin-antitoxin system prevent-host-death family antitoxin [Methylobacterium sp. E-025]|uniref:type II toxin-antitoxin system Phd/YefM family antitoxin n=1 Tax=Methylobacterium sp. E-025 TaxID=2836561 RepID=UPI001FB95B8E|nr:type II toxin-antitoxin system prevent-host-death family antitoxin [Methylobacterium sp. E-025]MCJ2110819.1 type II toxin-antitoxin system prevent-host-death family antitoxin [Methylobacterium sp. E-025]